MLILLLLGQALATEGWHHRLSGKHTFDRIHHTVALLLHRRNVAPQLAELYCSFLCSEVATDLLLDLQHSQITFRLIIIKRYSEIGHEQQYLISPDSQSVHQFPGGPDNRRLPKCSEELERKRHKFRP